MKRTPIKRSTKPLKRSRIKRKASNTDRQKYYQLVGFFTHQTVRTHPNEFPRFSETGEKMHIHHKIPKARCWTHGVPAAFAGSLDNLVAIPESENLKLGIGVREEDKWLEAKWRRDGIYLPRRKVE